MPRLRAPSRLAFASYPLSVMAARGAMSGPRSRRILEVATVAGFAAGQMKGQRQAIEIAL